jgi:hypothetical protein
VWSGDVEAAAAEVQAGAPLETIVPTKLPTDDLAFDESDFLGDELGDEVAADDIFDDEKFADEVVDDGVDLLPASDDEPPPEARAPVEVLDSPEPSVTEVTVPGDTAAILGEVVDEETYRARWGKAPLHLALPRPMQPSLEFLNPQQLSVLQAAHNHGNMDGVAEATRKDDEQLKKTVTFLLRSGYLTAR